MTYDIAGLDEEFQSYLTSTREGEVNFGSDPQLGKLYVAPEAGPYEAVVVFLSRAGDTYDLAQIDLIEGTFSLNEDVYRGNQISKTVLDTVERFVSVKGLEEEIEEEPIPYNAT